MIVLTRCSTKGNSFDLNRHAKTLPKVPASHHHHFCQTGGITRANCASMLGKVDRKPPVCFPSIRWAARRLGQLCSKPDTTPTEPFNATNSELEFHNVV